MTTYILAGGYVRKAPDGGKAFCEELVRGFEPPVKILDCCFAEPEEYWEEKLLADRELFATHVPGKPVEIELADEGRFAEQVRWADAIFLRGGETAKLLAALRRSGDWLAHLDGKTIAGTSAGADALAKYYYNLDTLTLGEGLGLVPVKVLPHYRSDYNAPNVDWDKVYRELKNYKEDLPMLTLAEGEFQVLKQGS